MTDGEGSRYAGNAFGRWVDGRTPGSPLRYRVTFVYPAGHFLQARGEAKHGLTSVLHQWSATGTVAWGLKAPASTSAKPCSVTAGSPKVRSVLSMSPSSPAS